jgi:predicted transcriptional regulator
MRPEQFPRTDAFANQLPQAVRQLPRREREVAMLIYRKGALTAMEIGSHVSGVSNGSIRTMLGRLVRKGILKRRRADTARPSSMLRRSARPPLSKSH